MAWQPSNEGLLQLLGLFKASSGADNAQHRAIQQQLRDFNAVPDYNNYLVYILNMSNEEGHVRQLAGLVLKNNVKEHWESVSPQIREYARSLIAPTYHQSRSHSWTEFREHLQFALDGELRSASELSAPILVPKTHRVARMLATSPSSYCLALSAQVRAGVVTALHQLF